MKIDRFTYWNFVSTITTTVIIIELIFNNGMVVCYNYYVIINIPTK